MKEVHNIWEKLDKGRSQSDLDKEEVMNELCTLLGLPKRDLRLSQYLERCSTVHTHNLDDKRIGYENFNNLFVKAIFKFILQ
jgi:hypothetical protein